MPNQPGRNFGPVVTIQPFETAEDAIQLANATSYGLAATIWTQDISRANRMAAAVQSGIIWINCWLLRDLRTPLAAWRTVAWERRRVGSIEIFTEQRMFAYRYKTATGSSDNKSEHRKITHSTYFLKICILTVCEKRHDQYRQCCKTIRGISAYKAILGNLLLFLPVLAAGMRQDNFIPA